MSGRPLVETDTRPASTPPLIWYAEHSRRFGDFLAGPWPHPRAAAGFEATCGASPSGFCVLAIGPSLGQESTVSVKCGGFAASPSSAGSIPAKIMVSWSPCELRYAAFI